jgi:hypothetical protein
MTLGIKGIQHSDTQHNDTQHNDTKHGTQHNDTQRNDIQHNNKLNTALSTTTLSIMVECCYAVSFMLSVTHA